jgi:hypothetical protein
LSRTQRKRPGGEASFLNSLLGVGGPDAHDPERTVDGMRPSLLLAFVVLIAVAAVFALMVFAGIGGEVAATTAPAATTVILQDTISPTGSGAAGGTSSTIARPTSTTASTTSTTAP